MAEAVHRATIAPTGVVDLDDIIDRVVGEAEAQQPEAVPTLRLSYRNGAYYVSEPGDQDGEYVKLEHHSSALAAAHARGVASERERIIALTEEHPLASGQSLAGIIRASMPQDNDDPDPPRELLNETNCVSPAEDHDHAGCIEEVAPDSKRAAQEVGRG